MQQEKLEEMEQKYIILHMVSIFTREHLKKIGLYFIQLKDYFLKLLIKLLQSRQRITDLLKKKFHCKIERIHGVGVDEKRYFSVEEDKKQKLRVQMGFNDNQKLILCIGELLPNKNQMMAIKVIQNVVKKYPTAILLLAGNGPEKEHLELEIANCGMQEHVKLLGYVTNLQDYQQIVDIVISCSKREGLPLNVVESMLSGTPVVATINRGHRELIKMEKTGI